MQKPPSASVRRQNNLNRELAFRHSTHAKTVERLREAADHFGGDVKQASGCGV